MIFRLQSRNFDVMTGLSKWDPPKTSLFTCSVKTICQNYNCVHGMRKELFVLGLTLFLKDSVINRWPHNATTFDLHYDYNVDMNESSVQTDYLN